MKHLLHIGCGPKRKDKTTAVFNTPGWHDMAHRCGFTQKVLDGTLRACGFQTVASMARGRAPFFGMA